MINKILSFNDIITAPITLTIIFLFAYIFVNLKYTDKKIKRYFITALIFRLIGAMSGVLIVDYYYQGGDMLQYYRGAMQVKEAILTNPYKINEILWLDSSEYSSEISTIINHFHYKNPGNALIMKWGGVIALFTLSRLPIAFIITIYSFLGCWLIFLTFYKRYPHIHKNIAIATLFLPSVFFWGTGLMKDTVTLAAVGFIVYYFFKIFTARRKKIIFSSLVILVNCYIAYTVKSYIILCLMPALAAWLFLTYHAKIRNRKLRILALPIFVAFAISSALLILLFISSSTEKFKSTNILDYAENLNHAFSENTNSNSSYSLGLIDFTPIGLMKVFPKAINVTLFRPYLWEARSPLLIPAAFESIFFLLLTMIILFKLGVFRILQICKKNPDVFFCLLFSIFFAIAVGITTGNFGSLMRYKIPCLPFYLLALFIILSYSPKHTNKELNH